jgi:ComF family protein
VGVLDLLLPPACAGCGRYGDLLCRRCVGALQAAGSGADRFALADAGLVVGEQFVLARAAFAHRGPARRALQRLKYGGAGRLALPLARVALPAFLELIEISGPATLVPVPVHAERLRQRGYNQAALLARELGAGAGLQVREILERRRATTRQHGLNRTARLANLRGAFGLREDSPVPDRAILVDDILTTSATLEACAAVLRDAGCTEVFGFAVAREV